MGNNASAQAAFDRAQGAVEAATGGITKCMSRDTGQVYCRHCAYVKVGLWSRCSMCGHHTYRCWRMFPCTNYQADDTMGAPPVTFGLHGKGVNINDMRVSGDGVALACESIAQVELSLDIMFSAFYLLCGDNGSGAPIKLRNFRGQIVDAQ